jgi:signal transduction histidine kinase
MQTINLDTITILGVPIIRGISLGIVGHIVSQLIETQDIQKQQLIKANLKLGKFANTLEELATSRERNRLARELHDTLAHTLTGVAVNLEATKLMVDPDQTEVLNMLDESLNSVRTGLTETRRALRDLRAKQLDDLGLKLALHNLGSEAAARADFQLKLDVQDDLSELSPTVEQTVYRITQEALENIVKHAEAKKVFLSLHKNNGELQLVIQDDGKGFEANVLKLEDKFGIKGIQERAAMINGKLNWQSTPDRGTVIRFSLEV